MKILVRFSLFFIVFNLNGQHIDFTDVDFTRADSIALNYSFDGKLDPKKIARELVKNTDSEIEKFRIIFRWVAENITYDVHLYSKKLRKENRLRHQPKRRTRWEKRFYRLYVRHTIKKQTTICEGYAWLLETMCKTVGLNCESIAGYGRTPEMKIGPFKANHAWNIVNINNKWYLCDPTWAAGTASLTKKIFFPGFNEIYFLADPMSFISNHYPLDKTWTLLIDRPTLGDFFNAPMKSDGFIENKIANYNPGLGISKVKLDSAFHLQFTMNKKCRSIEVWVSTLKNRHIEREFFSYSCNQTKEGYHHFEQCFKTRGTYDVNIYINGALTLIYKVGIY